MDPYLLNLIRACEAGRPCPPVQAVTTSGDWLSGVPLPADRFLDVVHRPLSQAYAAELSRRPRRERKANPGDPEGLSQEALAALDGRTDGEPVLTLAPGRIVWSGREDGLELPALRVAVAAISVWWIGDGRGIDASEGAGDAKGILPVGV